ncbi:MAG TPA: hypothetical protein VGQ99_00535 [Tepidisphaeraceae bacterium]|jgi:hypothetical protein|nr:hypothetical protein [Tepidisphaeraceae bacterium]
MVLVEPFHDDSLITDANAPFPAEVEFVISALEAGPKPLVDRQKTKRSQYRVRATLKLFSDPPEARPALLYTRNVTSLALAFLTNDHLTLSHGGILRIPAPSGEILKINCTVLRCREAAPGWFEGAIYFNREQGFFSIDNLPDAPTNELPQPV